VSYYNSNDGTNKFLKHVRLSIYSPPVAFPSSTDLAHTTPLGNGNSDVAIRKFPDTLLINGKAELYKFEGAFAHEMGHAYHNWTRCFDYPSFGNTFTEFFQIQVSKNGSTPKTRPGQPPWINTWGDPSKGRNEDEREQFANTFRFFLGSDITRGQGGPPPSIPGLRVPADPRWAQEGTVPGFKSPADNLQWGKQLRLLPELTGYWMTYGLMGFDLSWQGGADGYWQFLNGAGTWMKLQNYYEWYEWKDRRWNRVSPRYSVS
jgi:hypothetical protein